MSVTNIVVTEQQILQPPPIQTPIFVTGKDPQTGREKTIGQVDISKHLPWAAWFSQVAAFSTEMIVSATVDFGTIPAQDHDTELVALPTGIQHSQDAFIIPFYPPTPDALLLSAHLSVLGLHLVAVGHNYGAVGLTPGPLDLQWRIIPRRII